jgi:PIN domain nuclease of toxin-antitoxin system
MAGIVADTHAAIWYIAEPAKLSGPALTALDRVSAAGEVIFLASISLVEIHYLIEKGRIPALVLGRINDALIDQAAALELASLTFDIAQAVARISRAAVPNMPDRIIAATALHLGVPLVSRDRKIQATSIQTIW